MGAASIAPASKCLLFKTSLGYLGDSGFMSKIVALTRNAYSLAWHRQQDALGSAVVLMCGAALILAGQAFPI